MAAEDYLSFEDWDAGCNDDPRPTPHEEFRAFAEGSWFLTGRKAVKVQKMVEDQWEYVQRSRH